MVYANLKVVLPAIASTGMTKKEIAEAAGVSAGAVYRIAKGYLVRMDILGKVCNYLGLDASEAIIFFDKKGA